jgi:hypothetical protein
MKTKEVDFRTLRNMIRSKKDPRVWICGEQYYKDLLELDYSLGTKNCHFSYFGTRSILDIPVQIGHEKIKDDEIILLNNYELRIIKQRREQEEYNRLYHGNGKEENTED